MIVECSRLMNQDVCISLAKTCCIDFDIHTIVDKLVDYSVDLVCPRMHFRLMG